MALEAGPKSGRKVIEATGVAKKFGDKQILRDFSITVQRGDRIALVGPNGVGKTTLLNMLIGKEQPDQGEIKLGTNLELALFDQARAQLDGNMTLWESLTGDPDMRVSGKADQVLVRGQPKHVVGYLKEFLFDEAQARAPVRSLSGGEKARLLLAKIMARSSNLLVLDEPTNDLDVETLDLMQELLGTYDGTVLLVSHDRDFLDRVAATTIAMEGDGRATVYAGGWTDYLAQRGQDDFSESVVKAKPGKGEAKTEKRQSASGISFTEKHRLEACRGRSSALKPRLPNSKNCSATPSCSPASQRSSKRPATRLYNGMRNSPMLRKSGWRLRRRRRARPAHPPMRFADGIRRGRR